MSVLLTQENAGPALTGPVATPGSCRLTILIPCLNEAATIGVCVEKGLTFLREAGIAGEVLVADNGSTDDSRATATMLGARVVKVEMRGYGAALASGIRAARGRYIIMGDADDSYDLGNLGAFVAALEGGADLVMGNRFRGGIEAGAMPTLHRYLGNPVLSAIGRLLFGAPVKDFHCGLRGFRRESMLRLRLATTGMEFASEMVVRAALAGLRIVEVPTTLRKDGRGRPSHLHTWRDGWRHLRFLLLHSPRWVFTYPGLALMLSGGALALFLLHGPRAVGQGISLDIHTFLVACLGVLLGTQSLTFGVITRHYAERHGLLPRTARHHWLTDAISLETLLRAAGLLFAGGTAGLGWAFYAWSRVGFGALAADTLLRPMMLATTGLAMAVQLAFAAFLLGVLDLPLRDPL